MGSIVRSDKNKAMKLRLSGRSYNEITKELGVPKSTLAYWFTDLVLSKKAQARIRKRAYTGSVAALIKRNKLQTHIARQKMFEIRKKHKNEVTTLSKAELKLIGVALYWAEGYKRPQIRNGREITCHTVSLSNSDPNLVRLFLRFLTEVCNVPMSTMSAQVRIYQHINEQEAMRFWQKVTNLPSQNFCKIYYGVSLSSQHKRPYNRLPYGTIQIRVNNTALFHKIMGWIEGLSNQQ